MVNQRVAVNDWPGWASQVLAAAKLPVTQQNVNFLDTWHSYELNYVQRNNPLNVTAYAPIPITIGSGPSNSAGVQSYNTRAQGVAATAAFFAMPNYSAIRAALASGDPYSYATKSQSNLRSIVDALGTWGSRSFAAVFGYEQGSMPPPYVGDTVTSVHTDPTTGDTTTSVTSGPSWLGGLTGWLGSVGRLVLAYVLLIGVAGGLVLTGLKGLGVPMPKPPVVVPA